MSNLELRREAVNSAAWIVVAADGKVVVGPSQWDIAVGEAVRRLALSGGGVITSPRDGGGDRIVRRVPALAPSPGAAGEKAAPPGERIDKLAAAADELLGRASHKPPTLTDKLEGLEISQVLPPNVRDSRTVKILNTNVSAGAAGIAVVALVLGSGGVSAVTAPATKALASEATVGSYITVGQAFVFTLALSIAAAITFALFRSGQLKGAGAFGVVALIVVVVSAVTYGAGIAGPTPESLSAAAAKASNPPGTLFAVLGVFLAFYGPVPFLSGLIAGCCAGNIAHEISQADS